MLRRLAAPVGPWCAIVVVIAAVLPADLLLPAPAGLPIATATPRRALALVPFVEHDPAATLVCVSDHPGRILPPFLTRSP